MYKALFFTLAFGSTIFAGSCSIDIPLVCEWKVGALSSETDFLKEIDKQQEEKFLSMFEKIQDSEFFLLSASRGDNCVGFLIVTYDKRKNQLCIEMLMIKPSRFGSKVAQTLISKARERFDAESIAVACPKNNQFLHDLYTGLGFNPTRGVPGNKSSFDYSGLMKNVKHAPEEAL